MRPSPSRLRARPPGLLTFGATTRSLSLRPENLYSSKGWGCRGASDLCLPSGLPSQLRGIRFLPRQVYLLLNTSAFTGRTTRRDFLWQVGGLGGVALGWMLGHDGALADTPAARPDLNGGLHHRAKVRRIVQLFMNGGVSQV